MLAGADLLTGIGMLDAAQLLYLPKLVLDAEVVRQAERLRRGLALDDEHVMLELSATVGPGGHFLSSRESRRFLRDGEHLMPRLFVRGSYDAWAAQHSSEEARAAARRRGDPRHASPQAAARRRRGEAGGHRQGRGGRSPRLSEC